MRQARTTAQRTEETMSDETTRTGTRRARRGFDSYDKTVDGLNRTTLQVKDDSEVIVFLEDDMFHYALRHWIKFLDDNGQQVTRAEWCLQLEDEDEDIADCPLCNIGDRPKAVAFFNVVNLAQPGKVLVWEASADPTNAIKKEYNKLLKRGKHLNDDGVYWVVSREKGRNGFYTYSVDMVLEDELATEWPKLKPIGPTQREALRARMYDEEYVNLKDRQELLEFADSLG